MRCETWHFSTFYVFDGVMFIILNYFMFLYPPKFYKKHIKKSTSWK